MISIIMPVFNGEKYIAQAIKSVIAQTYPNWELIIVDDGSTDDTSNVIHQFKNAKIKYIYQNNQGPSAARNRGLDIAQGDYIAFLDADDLYHEQKLARQVTFLKENPNVDIIYNDVKVVDESLHEINELKSEGIYESKEDFLAMLLFRQIVPLPPSIMAKRKCFESGIRFNTNYVHGEDYDLTIRLAQKYQYAYLPQPLYIYRRHLNNLTNAHNKQVEAEIEITKNIGLTSIKQIVQASSFSKKEKELLLAKIFIKIEEYAQAKAILVNLLKEDSTDALIPFYIGNCCYNLTNYKAAIEYYQWAIVLRKNMAESYNNLGCAYGTMKDFTKAEKYFNQALTYREGYMDATQNLKQLSKDNPDFKITTRELRTTLTQYSIN